MGELEKVLTPPLQFGEVYTMNRYLSLGVIAFALTMLGSVLHLNLTQQPLVQENSRPRLECWIERHSVAQTKERIIQMFQGAANSPPRFSDRQLTNVLICEHFMFTFHLRNTGTAPAIATACR